MKVRGLLESDHATIVSVVDGWWGGRRVAEKLPRLLFRYFEETSFVIEEDGTLVAFLVGIAGDGEEAYIHFVGVHPEYGHRGIGRHLYERFFDEARQRGCLKVRSITSPVNEGSIAFHERLGFAIVEGEREVGGVSVHTNYDGDGKAKVVFERPC